MSNEQRERISIRAIIVVIALLAAAAIFNVYAILREPTLADPVLKFSPSASVQSAPVCPGDSIRIDTVFTINEPAVIANEINVISEATGLTVWHGADTIHDNPRDRAESVKFVLDWPVPDLPAGEYRRVSAIWAANKSAEPAFFVMYFTVGEDCQP